MRCVCKVQMSAIISHINDQSLHSTLLRTRAFPTERDCVLSAVVGNAVEEQTHSGLCRWSALHLIIRVF